MAAKLPSWWYSLVTTPRLPHEWRGRELSIPGFVSSLPFHHTQKALLRRGRVASGQGQVAGSAREPHAERPHTSPLRGHRARKTAHQWRGSSHRQPCRVAFRFSAAPTAASPPAVPHDAANGHSCGVDPEHNGRARHPGPNQPARLPPYCSPCCLLDEVGSKALVGPGHGPCACVFSAAAAQTVPPS